MFNSKLYQFYKTIQHICETKYDEFHFHPHWFCGAMKANFFLSCWTYFPGKIVPWCYITYIILTKLYVLPRYYNLGKPIYIIWFLKMTKEKIIPGPYLSLKKRKKKDNPMTYSTNWLGFFVPSSLQGNKDSVLSENSERTWKLSW